MRNAKHGIVNQMESNMRQTQLCHQTGRRIAHTGQLIALLAAGLIISPGRAGEPPGDWAGGLPSLDDARFGEPALLKSGLARSLIDDAMKVEPAPPRSEEHTSEL